MANKPKDKTEAEGTVMLPEDTPTVLTVVVLKGRSVKHDGVVYLENHKLDLGYADATGLIEGGFVITLNELKAQAVALESASAPMIQVNNGVIVTQEG